MSDPIATVINTLARDPHDVLRIVATHGSGSEAEVCEMQLPIGLGGEACAVPFRRGMMMTELRQEVSRMTGIPADEQVYVASDAAELVDDDAEVPVGRPPRCLRSSAPAAGSRGLAGAGDLAAEGRLAECEAAAVGRGCEGRTSWADLSEEASALLSSGNSDGHAFKEQQPEEGEPRAGSPQKLHGGRQQKEASEEAESLARDITARWRKWRPDERQHQFYIAIEDEKYLWDHNVAKRIRQACGAIYKEGQVMVRLRGRGSGFLEVKWKGELWESPDPLMICVSGRMPYDLDGYWTAFFQIVLLLEGDVYAEYNATEGRRGEEAHLDDDWINGGRRCGGRRPGQAKLGWR